jgi:hypothetical protein
MKIERSNFRLRDGNITIGKKYRYSESGRNYIVLLHDCKRENGIITLKIEVLETSPKPYSMPVGKILEVSITDEDVWFQGVWYLNDIEQ